MAHNKYLNKVVQNKTLPHKKIRDIDAKGSLNIALLEEGKVFIWPFEKTTGKYIFKPVELPLPLNVSISMISCGHNFAV